MKSKKNISKSLQFRRVLAMLFLIVVAFASLGYRLVDLQVFQHDDLRKEVEDKTHRTILRVPRRGDIRDRNGNLLAGSVFVKTLCANPTLIEPYQAEVAHVLAPLLEVDEASLLERLRLRTFVNERGETKARQFVIVKRKVSIELWDKVQATMKDLAFPIDETQFTAKERIAFFRNLRSSAFFVEPYDDQLRVYPNKSLAAHVIGSVGSIERETILGRIQELTGVDGIERVLNTTLTGVPGWRTTEVVQRHELVNFRDQDVEPHPGLHVVLTIDAGLQHIVESELLEIMQRHSPVSTSAIVVRPQTGEILALANYPTFDPNKPGDAPEAARRNRVVTDSAEPGSTFKIVAIAAALNEGIVTLDTQIDCEGGRFYYAGRSLKDDHPAGVLSVEGVVAKSSNIGTAKIGLQLGRVRVYEYIRQFGFGSPTGLPLPGEVRGIVHPVKQWDKLSITRLPIGQGIAVTPLQMVMAMSAIANSGRLMQPMLVQRVIDESGKSVVEYQPQKVRQIVSEVAARQMITALKQVVSTNGTARRARLDHYTVAGKTGTAQKPGKGGYMAGKYFSSFVGFFPADNPELCISVVLDEPDTSNYYGGSTAAPAFRNIAERAAKYLAIKPDLVPSESMPMTPLAEARHSRP